jgi:hypothetical protein
VTSSQRTTCPAMDRRRRIRRRQPPTPSAATIGGGVDIITHAGAFPGPGLVSFPWHCDVPSLDAQATALSGSESTRVRGCSRPRGPNPSDSHQCLTRRVCCIGVRVHRYITGSDFVGGCPKEHR